MAFSDLVDTANRAALEELGGVAVTYTPNGGSPIEVTGLFDRRYLLSAEGSRSGVEQHTPAVFLMVEDLAPTDPVTDEPSIQIEGSTYRVRERQPDTFGGILLLLHKVA